MRTRKMWNEKDLRVFKAKYADTNTAKLALRLGRKEANLHMKASAMGLTKSVAYIEAAKRRIVANLKTTARAGRRWTKKDAALILKNKSMDRVELAKLLGTTHSKLDGAIYCLRKKGWLPPFERKAKVLKVPKAKPIKILKPKKEKTEKVKKALIKTIKPQKPLVLKVPRPQKFKALEQIQGRTITSAIRVTKAYKLPVPKPPIKVFNRDVGKVAVQIDRRTWKYMLPEDAEQFKQAQL